MPKGPKTTRADLAALERLTAAADDVRRITEALDRAKSRRDHLIMDAHGRGISLRVIAKSAGVHFTRVRQLAQDADHFGKTGVGGLRTTGKLALTPPLPPKDV